MSALAIRAAFETALAAMTPAVTPAWENVSFAPVAGEPFQEVFILLAAPVDTELTGRVFQQAGYAQVNLNYPIGNGPADATARAELIRSTFYRGRSLTASGVTTNVERTPEIMPGRTEEDRFVIPVKVRFFANIVRS